MADIAEQICQAVDMIIEERLRSVNFDTTITATILDNRYAKINSSAAYGSSCVIKTIQQLTDVKIDFKNCRHFSRFFSALFISSSHKKAKMKYPVIEDIIYNYISCFNKQN